MRRAPALVASILLVSLAAGTAAAAAGTWKAPPFSSIDIKTVGPVGAEVVPSWSSGDWLIFFLETGSVRTECLATLNESTHVHATQLYCGHHSLTIDGTVRQGVSVSINLSVPIGDGQYWVNVYQEGAQFYGDPIPLE